MGVTLLFTQVTGAITSAAGAGESLVHDLSNALANSSERIAKMNPEDISAGVKTMSNGQSFAQQNQRGNDNVNAPAVAAANTKSSDVGIT